MRHARGLRLVAGLMALWLGLLQFPLPVTVRADRADKDHSVAFPCMNHPCGCATAEQCWTSCCCTTKAERVAWATKHLGYIPALLADAEDKPKPAAKGTCCSRRKAECATGACRTASKKCCDAATAAKKAPAKRPTVTLSAALKCRGVSYGWSLFAMAVPAGHAVVTVPVPAPCGPVVLRPIAAPLSLADAPPTPPPRV